MDLGPVRSKSRTDGSPAGFPLQRLLVLLKGPAGAQRNAGTAQPRARWLCVRACTRSVYVRVGVYLSVGHLLLVLTVRTAGLVQMDLKARFSGRIGPQGRAERELKGALPGGDGGPESPAEEVLDVRRLNHHGNRS